MSNFDADLIDISTVTSGKMVLFFALPCRYLDASACQFSEICPLVVLHLSMQFTSTAVSRRYKQFDWLQQRLVEKFSTIAIPPLPEKQIAGMVMTNIPDECEVEKCYV